MNLMRPEKAKIFLALTCHKEYFDYLPAAIESIEENSNFHNYLFLDNCDYNAPYGWNKITVEGVPGPSKLRNKAAEVAKSLGFEWIVYFDADNLMLRNFGIAVELKTADADKKVGVIYNDLGFVDYNKKKEYDLTECNFVDTASAWRINAIHQAGGWDEASSRCFDDWKLALRLKSAGYEMERLGVSIKHTNHGSNRGSNENNLESINQARSLGVVSLLSGKWEDLDRLFDFNLLEKYPNNTHFYFIDNSKDDEFNAMIHSRSFELIQLGKKVTIIRDNSTAKWNGHKDIERHEHVCGLYNRILKSVTEDLILFHEDDVIPCLGSFKELTKSIYPKTGVAGSAAAYRGRGNPMHCCASSTSDIWTNNPIFDKTNSKIKIGMVGGGYTVYLNHVIQKCLPLRCELNSKGALQGWDGNLGSDIHKLGYSIILDGTVKARHYVQDVEAFINKQNLPI